MLTGALLVASGTPALAADTRQGQAITVAAGETVDDDLYAFAGTIAILGTVRGDVVAFGGTVTVDGTVGGDLIVGAGTTTVRGQVAGSVRVASGNVTIDGRVGEDALVGSGTLNIGPGGRIGRDVLVAGGTGIVSGEIVRNLRGAMGDATLDGRIGGDTVLDVGTLRLGDRAALEGGLVYTSEREAERAAGATVRGTVERRTPPRAAQSDPTTRTVGLVVDWLRGFVAFAVLGLVMLLVLPAAMRRSADTLASSPLVSLGIGAAVLVGVPLVALIVFILGLLIGGWWLGALALALYLVAIAASVPVVALAIGRSLFAAVRRGDRGIIWAFLLGLVILLLVAAIPVVGGIVYFVAIVLGLGALTVAARRHQAPAVVRTDASLTRVSGPSSA